MFHSNLFCLLFLLFILLSKASWGMDSTKVSIKNTFPFKVECKYQLPKTQPPPNYHLDPLKPGFNPSKRQCADGFEVIGVVVIPRQPPHANTNLTQPICASITCTVKQDDKIKIITSTVSASKPRFHKDPQPFKVTTSPPPKETHAPHITCTRDVNKLSYVEIAINKGNETICYEPNPILKTDRYQIYAGIDYTHKPIKPRGYLKCAPIRCAFDSLGVSVTLPPSL